MQLYFSILGPLTAELRTPAGEGRTVEIDPGPFKQRLLIALLLCRCNSVVLVEQLIDALWWDGPPRTAHKNIQVYVSHLRKLLAADGRPGRLRYRAQGYQLVLTPAEVDALRFQDLSRAGREALRRGDARAAAAAARKALGMWRGAALADLQVSPVLREEAARLEDRRLHAYEDWFEAELQLGNHAEVLEEIEDVVRAHPLRERLRSHQLTALQAAGRQAEALAEYDNLRQMLAAELGLDPSPALQRLYRDILSGRSALSPPAPPDPPRARHADAEVVAHAAAGPPPRLSGLPRPLDDFTGRAEVHDRLIAGMDRSRCAAITGPPGSGTSALALKVAHALSPKFRNGAVMLQLRDAKGAPRPLVELAHDLLAKIEPLPGEPVAASDPATRLRSRLAGLQLLLIFDGATEEAQVRPLLPGSGESSVIVTSCRHLGGLEGVRHFPVGTFTDDEALELLRRLIGQPRLAADPDAAVRIVRACGLLPLAVRIAGARLAGLEHLPLERFAERLEDPGLILDELAVGDLSVRDRFDRYLQGLDPAERLTLMRVVAAWGPPSRDQREMERMLERLADVHALTIINRQACSPAAAPPFAMPRPLWIYAQQLLATAPHDTRNRLRGRRPGRIAGGAGSAHRAL